MHLVEKLTVLSIVFLIVVPALVSWFLFDGCKEREQLEIAELEKRAFDVACKRILELRESQIQAEERAVMLAVADDLAEAIMTERLN